MPRLSGVSEVTIGNTKGPIRALEEGVVPAREGGSPPCTGGSRALSLTYRLVVTFPNLCSCLLAMYAEEMMDGVLHGSGHTSPEFSVGTEGEGPLPKSLL